MVIDPEGPQAHLAEGTGTAAVRALVEVLSTRWPDVTGDDTVALISYAGEDVASYEVAPAFATETGFRIPNGVEWMDTNPHEHARMVTEKKNADCDGKFVPLVKMLKAINREAGGEPLNPSFLIEVMALDLVEPRLGRYQDEIRFFLASAADQIVDDWPDPRQTRRRCQRRCACLGTRGPSTRTPLMAPDCRGGDSRRVRRARKIGN